MGAATINFTQAKQKLFKFFLIIVSYSANILTQWIYHIPKRRSPQSPFFVQKHIEQHHTDLIKMKLTMHLAF